MQKIWRLAEASTSCLPTYLCAQLAEQCPNLVKCDVIEDDSKFERISALSHRSRNLTFSWRKSRQRCTLGSYEVLHRTSPYYGPRFPDDPQSELLHGLFPCSFRLLKLFHLHSNGACIAENDIEHVVISTGGLEDILISAGGSFPVSGLRKLAEINPHLRIFETRTKFGLMCVKLYAICWKQ